MQKIATSLRLIFWGGLLHVIDFNLKRGGWTVDIFNDFIGLLLITYGVFQLGEIDLNERYRKAMGFVKTVAVLSCLGACNEFVAYNSPPWLSFAILLLDLLTVVAIVIFCLAMRDFCREGGLERSERSWKTSALLFALTYCVPLGIFYLVSLFYLATGNSFNINFGMEALPIVMVFCIPLIHFFVSTSRMKSEMESPAHSTFGAEIQYRGRRGPLKLMPFLLIMIGAPLITFAAYQTGEKQRAEKAHVELEAFLETRKSNHQPEDLVRTLYFNRYGRKLVEQLDEAHGTFVHEYRKGVAFDEMREGIFTAWITETGSSIEACFCGNRWSSGMIVSAPQFLKLQAIELQDNRMVVRYLVSEDEEDLKNAEASGYSLGITYQQEIDIDKLFEGGVVYIDRKLSKEL